MTVSATQPALPQPPMSWRRKMSANTVISSQIQMIQAKNTSIVPTMSRNG